MLNFAKNFKLNGTPIYYKEFGSGHINTTYKMVCDSGCEYILQKINTNTFKQPIMLMENLASITAHLMNKVNNSREVLTLVPTINGHSHIVSEDGDYWRVFDFVANSICLQSPETPDDFYESAVAFGRFVALLIDFPAHTLGETIPHFHDTVKRYQDFKEALIKDPLSRAKDVQKEIEFVLSREIFASTFMDLIESGELPVRVTHNDAKLNNVLFDKHTRKGLCVIDLDTVMPGVVMNDFGDAIRFGASTGAEDEKDLSKIEMSLELFEAFTRGFLKSCKEYLTPLEISLLPEGAKMMTLECGMRFLGDYISGDTYFKIHYPTQNLDRFRTHMKLVSDMESKWNKMHEIIKKVSTNK